MVSSSAVQAMRQMARDPKKRGALIKDSTCIGGLVIVLSNQDNEIVKVALETLILLAECPDYLPVIRDFVGMHEQLEALLNREGSNADVHHLAEKLQELLKGEPRGVPLHDTSNTSTDTSRRSSFLKNCSLGGHRTRTLIFQLRGMIDRSDRELCMRLLLQVKGIISITFDLNKKRCILRTKPDTKPEYVVQTIARSQTMSAQQVIKDENGEELLLSFGTRQQDINKENEVELPDYLPDDCENVEVDDKAIAKNKKEKKSGGWLSTAANFITNSFYW